MTPTTFSGGVSASLKPWDDPQGAFDFYTRALGSMFDEVFSIVSDQGSPDESSYTAGFSTLLDPDACPAALLPYLGQFVGVFVPVGTDEATARSLIRTEAGFARGTAAAIVSAAKRNLSGSQSCILQERTAANGTADPYHAVLVVRPEEVISLSALQTAVTAVKPAGIQITVIETDSWLWNQATGTWAADTLSWNQAANQQP